MGQGIIVVAVPFTFSEKPLCPLEHITLDTLRLITWLKDAGNDVHFVNMRSKEHFFWKNRSAGINGKAEINMQIASRPQEYMREELLKYENADKILLVCDFPLSPYIFDTDVIRSLSNLCVRTIHGAEVYVCGSFFRIFPEAAKKTGLPVYEADFEQIRLCQPDIDASVSSCANSDGQKLGFFQLSDGCPNKCSFCVAGQSSLHKFSAEESISYLKKLNENGISEFWNLDQNLMMFPEHTEHFINLFAESGISGELNFSLGFQPDRITDGVINALKKVRTGLLTVPFETGTSESWRRIGKPYTIISAIKAVRRIRSECGNAVRRITCSFVIGYRHDDFRSIFRIFLAILRCGGAPIPFPIYVFPNTREYAENRKFLENKDINSLHGQLWPLVSEEKLPLYRKMLHFLRTDKYEKAVKAAPMFLSPDLLAIFREEQHRSAYFVQKCLDSEGDDVDFLERIERDMESRPELGHPVVLHISSSPRKNGISISRALGEAVCKEIVSKNKDFIVENLDIYKDRPVFLDEEYIRHIHHEIPYNELSDEAKKAIDIADRYIAALKRADIVVVSAPMYTLSIPSALKAFFELAASRLYYYFNERLFTVPVCCAISREGMYGNDTEFKSAQEDSLSSALSFIGLTRHPQFIIYEGHEYSGEKKQISTEMMEKVRISAEKLLKNHS